jgi:hypothetical protein
MHLRSLQWSVLRSVQSYAPMAGPSYREWIAGGLLQKGKSKGGLGKALGVHQSQVTRLLDGNRQLKAEEVPIVARYLGIPVPAQLQSGFAEDEAPFEAEAPDERGQPTVKVVGYVGAGATAHFYAVAQGELDEVAAPEGATPDTVAVEIRGNSLGELFDRWLVFYDQVRRPITSDLIGRLCVVGLADDRVLVKKIRRGRDGRYDLHSNTEEPIRDVEIDWAARVKSMVPR